MGRQRALKMQLGMLQRMVFAPPLRVFSEGASERVRGFVGCARSLGVFCQLESRKPAFEHIRTVLDGHDRSANKERSRHLKVLTGTRHVYVGTVVRNLSLAPPRAHSARGPISDREGKTC